MQKVNFILASGSPRRKEILARAGITYTVVTSDVPENTDEPDPEKKVKLLSRRKTDAVFERVAESEKGKDFAVIGADTLVACGGKILGKPADRDQAIAMIRLLQGRTHHVFTGVTVRYVRDGREDTFTFVEGTEVMVAPMTQEQIEEYVDSGEPFDKAGGYGIQGRFGMYVDGIRGDYNNVVGLPLAALCRRLRERDLM